jgi:excisionase family DNA binding protein
MPTISFSITDEDVDRIAKRFAIKLAEALKEVPNPRAVSTEPKQPPTPTSPPAEWLTPSDIRQMFQVSRATVYRWTHEEGMPVRRVGGVVRLPADKVRGWAEKHSITMPASDKTTAG